MLKKTISQFGFEKFSCLGDTYVTLKQVSAGEILIKVEPVLFFQLDKKLFEKLFAISVHIS